MKPAKLLPQLMLILGLAGAPQASSVLFGATLIAALTGLFLMATKALPKSGWETPKELRLMHFAFWFFVLVSAIAWANEGFSYEGGKHLGTHAWLILFWPLVMAFSYSGLRATGAFIAITLCSISAILTLAYAILFQGLAPEQLFEQSFGGSINDFLNMAATRDIAEILTWAFLLLIPLSIFGRYLFSQHRPAACLAAAGTMLPVGYTVFGLIGAIPESNLLLTFYLLANAGLASALFNELNASYTRNRKVKVSATIITKNEEDHMVDCLKSARLVADEIIVLDSGSTDRTVELARQYADIVEVTDWPGFGIQKQRALDKATGDWVLSLDADERITPMLAKEINHHLAAPDADAYKLPWAVTIYGTRLDFGRSGRAPLRLFRREGVSFSDALVHERILIPEGRKTRTLRGRMTHYTHRDFGHSLEKSAKYAWLGSLEKHRKGKKTRTMIYPTLRGLMTFVQVYFVRFGFLDGAVGYLTAVTYAQVTFNKYAGLWTLGREK